MGTGIDGESSSEPLTRVAAESLRENADDAGMVTGLARAVGLMPTVTRAMLQPETVQACRVQGRPGSAPKGQPLTVQVCAAQ